MSANLEVTGSDTGSAAEALAPVAYTIETFCRAHHISRAFYHKLRGQGLGPRLTRIGSRVLITVEAAAAWRAAREAETIQKVA